MEEIMNILTQILGYIIGLAVVYAVKVGSAYLNQARENAKLDTLVTSAVRAAEQLFKADDEYGEIRMEYVQNLLIDAGYDLTDAVMALIESKVYNLNIEARK